MTTTELIAHYKSKISKLDNEIQKLLENKTAALKCLDTEKCKDLFKKHEGVFESLKEEKKIYAQFVKELETAEELAQKELSLTYQAGINEAANNLHKL